MAAEDEVLGLHSVPDVETSALKRSSGRMGGDSLAACVRWEAAAEQKAQAVSVSLGCLSVAYPAGFATELAQFIARSAPSGQRPVTASLSKF